MSSNTDEISKMKPTSESFETERSLKARERFLIPPPQTERQHQWLARDGGDRFIYTNFDDLQYKGQVTKLPNGYWRAVVKNHPDGGLEFQYLQGAQRWIETSVEVLQEREYNWYGGPPSHE